MTITLQLLCTKNENNCNVYINGLCIFHYNVAEKTATQQKIPTELIINCIAEKIKKKAFDEYKIVLFDYTLIHNITKTIMIKDLNKQLQKVYKKAMNMIFSETIYSIDISYILDRPYNGTPHVKILGIRDPFCLDAYKLDSIHKIIKCMETKKKGQHNIVYYKNKMVKSLSIIGERVSLTCNGEIYSIKISEIEIKNFKVKHINIIENVLENVIGTDNYRKNIPDWYRRKD